MYSLKDYSLVKFANIKIQSPFIIINVHLNIDKLMRCSDDVRINRTKLLILRLLIIIIIIIKL